MINENIDLTEILKNCPLGTEFWSPFCGNVILYRIGDNNEKYPIEVRTKEGNPLLIMSNAKCKDDGEIMLFPSRYQRDWSKFSILKKKEHFDPKTLQPF